MELIVFILLGVLGGFARALYGLLKAVSAGIGVNKGYFLITLVMSGFIGGLLGAVFDIDFKVAALAGYVGTDVLENVFKSTLGKKVMLKKK